jgi:hypothetical protein
MGMKKIALLFILLFTALGIVACQSNGEPDENLPLSIRMSEDVYEIDESFIQFPQFESPTGISFFSNSIVVADSGKSCLFVFDTDGKYVKTIGSIGMGPLQFFSPTGVYARGDLLYVVDARNNRVQILDEQFEYVNAYALEPIDSEMSYRDIVVDNDGMMYVSSEYGPAKYAHIYRIDPQTCVQYQIGNDIIGSVAITHDNAVLFANSLEISHEKGSTIARSGENYLYTVSSNKVNIVATLPYKYEPQDFLCKEGNLYMIGFGHAAIDKFTLDGTYIETMYQFQRQDQVYEFHTIVYDAQDEYFLISSPNYAKVFCVRLSAVKESAI